jgi:ribonuclease HI
MQNSKAIEYGQSSGWPTEVIVYTDGACRGNPGPSSVGIAVTDKDGLEVYEFAAPIGRQTNNFAEYSAVKKALELALANGVESLVLRSDSELLIKQMKGIYKVKSDSIKGLYMACDALRKKIKKVNFEHVRREFNERADALANQALDQSF